MTEKKARTLCHLMVSCLWENCNSGEFDSKQLYEHIQSSHVGFKRQGTLTTQCKWVDCNFTSERRDRMRSHVLCHINSKLYECELCLKSYKWKHDLYAHQRKIHGKEKINKSLSRRKSQNTALMTDLFPLNNDSRRSTISDLDLAALTIANQNMDTQQMCNPESFCLDGSSAGTELSDSLEVRPVPVRRHSMHSVMPLPAHGMESTPPYPNQRRLSSVPVFAEPMSMVVPSNGQFLQTGSSPNFNGNISPLPMNEPQFFQGVPQQSQYSSRAVSPLPDENQQYSSHENSLDSSGSISPMPMTFIQQYNNSNPTLGVNIPINGQQLSPNFQNQGALTPDTQVSPNDWHQQQTLSPARMNGSLSPSPNGHVNAVQYNQNQYIDTQATQSQIFLQS